MRIETAEDLKRARQELRWSLGQLARALRMGGDDTRAAETRLREMERGSRPIGAQTALLVEAFRDGWRPDGWSDDDAAE